MQWALAAGLGILGALAAEAAEVQLFLRKEGRPPWDSRARQAGRLVHGVRYPPLSYYLLATLLRSFTAGVLVGAYGAGSQVTGPIGALTLGVGASVTISRLAGTKDLGTEPSGIGITHPPTTVDVTQSEQAKPRKEEASDGA